ncbi:MAG: D-alanyl-D-alanine carboxypeptidase/D-alanyl-D-alanine-endopeptidase [Planctomycetes bacterium]|nr:D-alanyl-D-alanine carboxypeptidase/D-alanyl-D-alanine-endopeptidase [Planctomycetota bacterium]
MFARAISAFRIGRGNDRAAFALALAAFAGCAIGQVNELTDDAKRAMSTHKFGEARVGICIFDGKSGTMLANVRAEEGMTPASNMKLLTSGAAVLVLGPDFSFRTELIQDGDRLIFKGDGDPSLADPELLERMDPKMTVGDMLSTVAAAASKAGMTQARELVIDDRVFDRQYVHPTWPADQLSRNYCAEVSGLNFHANVLHVFPSPSPDGPGSPAAYSLQPDARWLRFDVRARTVAEGNNSAWLTREENGTKFVIRGEVRNRSLSPIEVTIHDPATFAGKLLARSINQAGISLPDDAVRLADADEKLDGGKTIAVINTPIAEVLKRCNTDSMNLYAECLLKRVGHKLTNEPGSWSNGAAVLRMVLAEKLGEAAAGTVVADGSGMSRDNLVAPATFARWLDVVGRDPKAGAAYKNSLAEIGSGTLRKRFQGMKLRNHLQAKSGYINGVRTLSGFLTDPETGRQITFSVMVNNIKNDEQHRDALELHEQIVKIADTWLTQRSAADRPAAGG